MTFTHDTESALVWSAALINSRRRGEDLLPDPAALHALFDEHQWTGRRDGDVAELDAVLALRPILRRMWLFDDLDTLVDEINAMLTDAQAAPQLARHGDWGWHLHLTRNDAPFVDRIRADSAAAFAELVRSGELSRLRACESPDCDAVLIDLSRNRSRRFCDTGNCGNRANVAAYRARKKTRPTT